MAEVKVEATFLGSLKAINEEAEILEDTNGASGQQIESSSSDEYDPAQDVQDVLLTAGSQGSSNQVLHVDASEYNRVHSASSSEESSYTPTNGVATLAPELNHSALDQLETRLELTDNAAASTEVADSTAPSASKPDSTVITPNPDIGAPVLDGISNASVLQTDKSPILAVTNSTLPKARLPHDKVGMLEDRIKDDERGDMDAWLSLISEHRKRGKVDESRKTYERFFGVFPSAAEQWVAYTQLESEAQNRAAVEAIFNKTLKNIPSLQLWSAYLDHIRRYYNIATDKTGSASQINHAAYEAVLDAIGIDRESGRLWQDYIQFIKSGPGVIGGSNWQDQQKMDVLRRAYQRAICVPTQAVETLWREYNAFEMSLNKVTGRKFLQDQSPAHMTARSSYTELQNITRDLNRTTLPTLPPVFGFDGDIEYMKQVEIWKRWIQWEKDDPLVLKDDNMAGYKARVVYLYKQALMALQFWPEMWFDAAEFCLDNSLDDEGNDFLNQGISANPESSLLAYKRADRLELSTTSGNDDESKRIRGAKIREPYDKLLDALYELVSKAQIRETNDIARVRAQTFDTDPENGTDANKNDHDDENEDDHVTTGAEKKIEAQVEVIKSISAVQIRLLYKTISHAWITLMRAMQRVQGKGKVGSAVGGSRQVFTDARKRGRILSDTWIAAAMLEFHSFEGEATKKIFERGLKLFPEDEEFALEYIKHLIASNDHTNARVVFETAVGRLAQKPETAAKAKPLYAFFHGFESRYGELSQIVKLEKRMRDTFPNDPRLASFAQRYMSEGFDPTAARPVISPLTQTRPRMMPTIEAPSSQQDSPPNRFIQTTQPRSPKRQLPLEESETEPPRPHKVARGESPLAGAAGRRLGQQKRNQQPHQLVQFEGSANHHMIPPPALPRDVLFLLSIIPKASTYHATMFKPEAMVKLIRDVHFPPSVNQLRLQPPGNNGVIPHHIPQVSQGQYNGQFAYNR